jgi:Domain of unknown function (DUF222)/HNH endonuclease
METLIQDTAADDRFAAFVNGLIPARPISVIADEITLLSGHLNSANHRLLTLIAEFDNRNGWNDEGCQSCAHWLNFKCGIDMGAAREKVRVAHAIAALPKISAAMEAGQISYSKVRAITRIANEQTEDYLLMIALHGTADHVEKLVRHFRRAKEAEELGREAAQQANRYLSYSYDSDGSVVLKGRIPAEVGALFVKALNAAVGDLTVEDVSAETSDDKIVGKGPSIGMQRADALALMAESFLAGDAESLSGGDKHQVVVHVDAETLKHSCAGRCEFEEGASMAAETARRLACDSSVVTIIEDEKGEPLSVGRKTRSIPPALKRALNSRDQGCRFPGCSNTKFVDGHHVEHWARGGETKLSNLVTLCRFHHRLVHEGGVSIQILDDGAFRFIRPDGRAFESVAPNHNRPLSWMELPAQSHERGIRVDARTSVTRWQGERMDYGMGVQTLLEQEAGRRPSVVRGVE